MCTETTMLDSTNHHSTRLLNLYILNFHLTFNIACSYVNTERCQNFENLKEKQAKHEMEIIFHCHFYQIATRTGTNTRQNSQRNRKSRTNISNSSYDPRHDK